MSGPTNSAEGARRANVRRNKIAAERIAALREADDFFRWAESTRRAYFVFSKSSLKALRT